MKLVIIQTIYTGDHCFGYPYAIPIEYESVETLYNNLCLGKYTARKEGKQAYYIDKCNREFNTYNEYRVCTLEEWFKNNKIWNVLASIKYIV